jgi:hypothetical protein
MESWVLIVAMLSPGGNFIDKQVVDYEFKTQKECQQVARNIPALDSDPSALGVRHRGLCVTKDHWTGKRYMKDMPLD